MPLRRFDAIKSYYLVADNWEKVEGYNGGHYDATLDTTKDMDRAYFKIHAPNPTDDYV